MLYVIIMDIFVISLQRSHDRKLYFDSNNSKYMTKYTYWDAVDGKTIDISKLDETIFTRNSKKYSPGAVGCALSHLQLWEKCIELNRPIVIMEDDVIVNYNFTKHLNNLMNNMLPKDWDIVQLSYNFDSVLSYNNTVYEQCNCIFNKTSVTKNDISKFVSSKINTTIAKLNYSFGAAAYIINPNGAKILKEKCFPLNNTIVNIPFLNNIMCFTIDCMMNTVYKDISAYVTVIPFVMTPHISEDYKTTIE
jgi:GR25 family glycosyltransferase involved in LPS biosynthesis